MSDTKTPVTLEEIRDLIVEFRNESKMQIEQVTFRLESILTRGGAPKEKKTVVKKTKAKGNTKKKEIPNKFYNTMYWWMAMYATQDPVIEGYYTEEDVKKAIEKVKNIKNKAEGYDRQLAIGQSIWRGIPSAKRVGELKPMFENWKLEKAKEQAQDVEQEEHTDKE